MLTSTQRLFLKIFLSYQEDRAGCIELYNNSAVSIYFVGNTSEDSSLHLMVLYLRCVFYTTPRRKEIT